MSRRLLTVCVALATSAVATELSWVNSFLRNIIQIQLGFGYFLAFLVTTWILLFAVFKGSTLSNAESLTGIMIKRDRRRHSRQCCCNFGYSAPAIWEHGIHDLRLGKTLVLHLCDRLQLWVGIWRVGRTHSDIKTEWVLEPKQVIDDVPIKILAAR